MNTLYQLSYKLSFSSNNKLAEKEIRGRKEKNKTKQQQNSFTIGERGEHNPTQYHHGEAAKMEVFLIAWHHKTTFTNS